MTLPATRGPVGGDIPRWKMLLASAVLAAIALGAVAGAVWGRHEEATRDTARGGDAGTTAAHPPTERERAALVAAASAALDAWEAFGATADLERAREAFVAGGPQYRQFEQEARSGRAGVARVPTFVLRAVTDVRLADGRGEVSARIALSGEPRDIRHWRFVLRRVSGSWRVWTVVDQVVVGQP